ncbi:MAG: DUF4038 domain-containing protein [Armatimonadetes bacterium]|nr:DUF4038 domain-containing protein [Armatimonadota bacterium]
MGIIRVSDDGRGFTDWRGVPFFWLGTTEWELFRLVTPDDADAILAERKRQGFSVVQVMISGVGDGRLPNLAGETPWHDHDPARPNERYFEQVDQVVSQAFRRGMILVMGLYHQLHVNTLTVDKARAYAKWVARRYRDMRNVVWSMYPQADPAFAPVVRELAAGLREGDGGAHLITVHPDPSPTSSSFLHTEPWLDFNCLQTWNDYELVPPMVAADYALNPVKPVVMAEGGYEGVRINGLEQPLAARRQAWWTCLCGGHYTYGHDLNYRSPGTWREWIGAPGARQAGILREVVTGCPEWWRLVPDPELIAGDPSSGFTQQVAARSASGEWALVYLPAPGRVDLRLGRLAGEALDVERIDPASGARTPLGTFPRQGIARFVVPAGWEDGVLALRTVASP